MILLIVLLLLSYLKQLQYSQVSIEQQNYQKYMEQRQLMTRSQQKLQKMNSSMLAFRELIQSLRLKNQLLVKPTSSQINPEMESSSHSRIVASQKAIPYNIPKIDNITVSNFSAPAAVVVDDQGIRLKARGHVAGRDILNKKPTILPSSKFNQTVLNNRQHAKNKNIVDNTSAVYESDQHPALQQIKFLMAKHNSTKQAISNHEPIPSQFESQQQYKISHTLIKTAATLPLNKPKFHQNKLNIRAQASRNKIKNIDQKIIIKYCKQVQQLRASSQASQIYDYFQGLMNVANVAVLSPYIKKFKNCIYFGMPISEDQQYEGFLYFYDGKIYFGEFYRNQKHGKGVEVYFQDQTIYKGTFKQGQKTGKFWVKKPEQNYIGFLEKGVYHGQGKLETKQSIYQGQFQNGEKHGFGQEFFPKTGVRMTGYFDRGNFSKRSRSSFSHAEIDRGIKFKVSSRGSHKLGNHNRTAMIKNQNSFQQIQSPASPIEQYRQQTDHYTSPFYSSSTKNTHNHSSSHRIAFNRQKIRSMLPQVPGQLTVNKFIEPMPENNCKDYDYSFDVSSKKQTQHHFGLFNRMKMQQREHHGVISEIDEQHHHQRLNSSALEEPLPMPCFYKK